MGSGSSWRLLLVLFGLVLVGFSGSRSEVVGKSGEFGIERCWLAFGVVGACDDEAMKDRLVDEPSLGWVGREVGEAALINEAQRVLESRWTSFCCSPVSSRSLRTWRLDSRRATPALAST